MTTTAADAIFEDHRDRLFGVGYRMTGSVSDANDLCQEAWLRWQSIDVATVHNPEAYLVRTVTRLAIDRSQSAAARRERYVGHWLPEPVLTQTPEDAAVLADSMTFAFLVLLDELAPVERAVFVMHDVFGYSFADIALAVDRSAATCRQIASRARRRVHAHSPGLRRFTLAEERALIDRAIERVILGDVEGLMELLAPDVVAIDDGGPNVRAARHPIVGSKRVARFLINLAKRIDASSPVELVTVNDRVGLYFRSVGAVGMIMTFDVDSDGTVCRIFAQLNPDKLGHLRGAKPTPAQTP